MSRKPTRYLPAVVRLTARGVVASEFRGDTIVPPWVVVARRSIDGRTCGPLRVELAGACTDDVDALVEVPSWTVRIDLTCLVRGYEWAMTSTIHPVIRVAPGRSDWSKGWYADGDPIIRFGGRDYGADV